MLAETYPAAAAGQPQRTAIWLTFYVSGRISPAGREVSGVSGWRVEATLA
jgi:hypothetical protein